MHVTMAPQSRASATHSHAILAAAFDRLELDELFSFMQASYASSCSFERDDSDRDDDDDDENDDAKDELEELPPPKHLATFCAAVLQVEEFPPEMLIPFEQPKGIPIPASNIAMDPLRPNKKQWGG